MKKCTSVDCNGQDIFIGLDVHKKQWHVAIRMGGLLLNKFTMDPDPLILFNHLHQHYPGGNYHSVYEAGFSGFWAHRQLRELGIGNIVVNAADIPTTSREKDRKSDPVDAFKLARELENGSLRGIYVPDEYHQQLRSLVRLRYRLVQDQTRWKNRIKKFLDYNGVELRDVAHSSHWGGSFIKHLRSLRLSHSPGDETLQLMIDQLLDGRARLLDVMRRLRVHSRQGPAYEVVYKYLLSVPGVGFKTAITFYTEIIDIHRFPGGDELFSYVGLPPAIRSSGEASYVVGLSYRRNRYLRHLAVEAAWVSIRKDPALLLAYQQLFPRVGKQRAIIRIAKKLVNRMRYVWRHQQKYVMGVIQ